MKELVLIELEKEFNWKERIILSILKKYTYRIYGIATKKITNQIL